MSGLLSTSRKFKEIVDTLQRFGRPNVVTKNLRYDVKKMPSLDSHAGGILIISNLLIVRILILL